MATNSIRVLCVDDHRIVREGIALIIDRQKDMEVVGTAASGEEAVELSRHRPDVTLMDLQLGAMCGVQAIRAIRAVDPSARVVALTMYQGDEDIYRALEAGRDCVSSEGHAIGRPDPRRAGGTCGEHPALAPDVPRTARRAGDAGRR